MSLIIKKGGTGELLYNPIAFWHLNEISGNRIDATNNSYTLSEGDASVGSAIGKIGNAANFNGTTSKFLTNSSISLGSTFSISCWVKLNSYNPNNEKGIWGCGTSGNHLMSFYILNSNNTFRFYNDGVEDITTSFIPDLNTWYHTVVAVTPNGAKLYIDGNLIGSVVYSPSFDSSWTNFSLSNFYTDGPAGYPIDAVIDEAGIWDIELSQQQVTNIYRNIPILLTIKKEIIGLPEVGRAEFFSNPYAPYTSSNTYIEIGGFIYSEGLSPVFNWGFEIKQTRNGVVIQDWNRIFDFSYTPAWGAWTTMTSLNWSNWQDGDVLLIRTFATNSQGTGYGGYNGSDFAAIIQRLPTFYDYIYWGLDSGTACGKIFGILVVGDELTFCDSNTFTGEGLIDLPTGTIYISYNGQLKTVNHVNGNDFVTFDTNCTNCVATFNGTVYLGEDTGVCNGGSPIVVTGNRATFCESDLFGGDFSGLGDTDNIYIRFDGQYKIASHSGTDYFITITQSCQSC
jgi:hypothetical protein